MEKVVALTKRRGFIYPSSEIYGGLSGFYDYGPYGVALKRAIRDLWWRHMVELRDDVVGLESTLIMPSQVWEASGHLAGFTDPLVQCLGKCKRRWREDHLREAVEAEGGDPDGELRCPECGGELSEPRQFNLMFETYAGPVQDEWFVGARMKFEHKPGTNEAQVRELLERRKASQPIGEWSCGSVFTNPPGDHAARLVEASGLKGYRLGDASVSQKHANFIINHGNATADDLERLIGHVRDTVEREHGVRLNTEVRIMGAPG